MPHDETQRDPMVLFGIETKASNDSAGAIGDHWKRFYEDDVFGKVPERLGTETIAVYCEYEGDHTKPYTFFLGFRVDPAISAPEGLVRREVPGGTYVCVVSQGKQPMALLDSWTKIWQMPLERTFVADYEVHHADDLDRIEIYVGV